MNNHYVAKCNNCETVMFDENPSQNLVDIDFITEPIENMVFNGHEHSWGCPKCETDGFLKDYVQEPITIPQRVIDMCLKADIVTVDNMHTDSNYYEEIDVIYEDDDVNSYGIYFGGECIIDESNINECKIIGNNHITIDKITFFLYRSI